MQSSLLSNILHRYHFAYYCIAGNFRGFMAIRENFLHEFGGMVQFGGTTSEQSTKGFSTNLRKPAKVLHYTVQYTYSVNIAYPGKPR